MSDKAGHLDTGDSPEVRASEPPARPPPALQPAPRLQPSASYSFTMRLHIPQHPGSFARVASAIGDAGAILGAIDLVRVEDRYVVRDVTVACGDAAHAERVVAATRAVEGVVVHSVSDRTFLLH